MITQTYSNGAAIRRARKNITAVYSPFNCGNEKNLFFKCLRNARGAYYRTVFRMYLSYKNINGLIFILLFIQ